jgi:hypothetical protein
MTGVSPLVFPPSRTLASWWKQLASFGPRAIWTGHLLLHRVEALAAVHVLSPLDPIPLFLLKAMALTGRGSLADLEQCIHLGLPLLRQVLRSLESENLVLAAEEGTWSLTTWGRQALEQGSYVRIRSERRAFYFVENEQPAKPPHFLHLRKQPAATACPVLDGWRFEPSHLQSCIDRPAEWKQRFDFPLEVQQILDASPVPAPDAVGHVSNVPPQARTTLPGASGSKGQSSFPAWQRVILDRPERLVVAVVLAPTGKGEERLLGFSVQPEGWTLQAAEPAFVVEADWPEVFPDLSVAPPLDQWRHAWRAWCQPRGLPAAEVDSCVLERHAHRLRILAAPRLVERLRVARSDVFKGEAWLLAGTSRLRPAAQVELVEMKRERSAAMPP